MKEGSRNTRAVVAAIAAVHWDMGVLPSNDRRPKTKGCLWRDAGRSVDASLLLPDRSGRRGQAVRRQPGHMSVLAEMTRYAASPTHQDPMPSYLKASWDDQDLLARLRNTPGLGLDAEVAKLKSALQADFNTPQ